MRRSLGVLLVAVLAFAPVARADLKIGYVDLQRALAEVYEGQSAKQRLKGEVDKKKTEFDGEQAKLRDDKIVLDKQASMMSEEVRNEKYAEMQRRLLELTQKAERLQVELADKERQELKKIFEKMDPIIAAIAQRENLSAVLEKTDSGLVYALPSLDLTNELVRSYNDRYPTKGGAKAAAPQSPASSGTSAKKP